MEDSYQAGNQANTHAGLSVDHILDAAEQMSDSEVLDLADALHDLLRARRSRQRSVQSYAILRTDAEWQIVCSRRRMGHFKTRDQALQAGARLARLAIEEGHPVEFLVQQPAGELCRQDPVRLAAAVEPRSFAPTGDTLRL